MAESVECKQCGKRFDMKDALEQHMKDKHTTAAKSVNRVSIRLNKKSIMMISVGMLVLTGIAYGIYLSASSPYSNVGAVGSTHIHTDLAVYMNGINMMPLNSKYFVKASNSHMEGGPGAGFVVHVHASNLPLGMFLDSLGMKLGADCFRTDTGIKYCNDGANTLKMFVKHWGGGWEAKGEFDRYVIQDLDKILVSYGSEGEAAIIAQQDSVTDFSKDNSGRKMALG